MEGRFKLRISRIFRASFGSCRSRNIADFIEKPVFLTQNRRDSHLNEPLSPKIHTFPSMCRSRWPEKMEVTVNNDVVTKVSGRNQRFVSGDTEGRAYPPASPIAPLNSYNKFQKSELKERKKDSRKTKKTHKKNSSYWFSSEDDGEDETDTFFSSKSLSSDSSESRRRRSKTSRRRAVSRNSDISLGPFVTKGKVRESFAVVKSSNDPYNDFRTSMVEMIVEKKIFAAKDLEQLLQCFLSLNSSHHHKVIEEVFSEIWGVLFSNWS